jgi:transposase
MSTRLKLQTRVLVKAIAALMARPSTALELAEHLEVSRLTVYDWLKIFEDYGVAHDTGSTRRRAKKGPPQRVWAFGPKPKTAQAIKERLLRRKEQRHGADDARQDHRAEERV